MDWSIEKICWVVFHIVIQVGYAWWNFSCLFTPIMTTRHNSILLPTTEEDELIEPTPLTSSTTTMTTTTTTTGTPERESFHIE